MPEDDEERRADRGAPSPGYGVGRLLTLSDGVFGIAMTLLVLDLGFDTSLSAPKALLSSLSNLAIYLFSFAMVAIFWLNHVAALRTLSRVTNVVLFRNLVLLGLVCIVPFASAFYQRFSGTTIGDQVYAATLFLLALASAFASPWRGRLEVARRSTNGRQHVAGVLVDQIGSLPAFLAGFIIAWWYPQASGWVILALILLGGALERRLLRGFTEDPRRVVPDQARDEYGVGRVLALSDGVFAIAMTILVLNIGVPEVKGVATNAGAWAALKERTSALVSFVISFFLVGLYWVAHHRALRNLNDLRQRILTRNLGWLCAVCLVPFVTNYYDSYSGSAFADQVFFGMFVVLGLLSGLITRWPQTLSDVVRGRAPIRAGVADVIDQLGAAPAGVAGIIFSPILGAGSAQLCWALMFPIGVGVRALRGGPRLPGPPRVG